MNYIFLIMMYCSTVHASASVGQSNNPDVIIEPNLVSTIKLPGHGHWPSFSATRMRAFQRKMTQLQIDTINDLQSRIGLASVEFNSGNLNQRRRESVSSMPDASPISDEHNRRVSMSNAVSSVGEETYRQWTRKKTIPSDVLRQAEIKESEGLPVLPVFPEPPMVVTASITHEVTVPAKKTVSSWLCCCGSVEPVG